MNRDFFNKIHDLLLKKKAKVEQEIKEVQEDDPVLADGLAEASESGTESWKSEAHTRLTAMKDHLNAVLSKVQKALVNIKSGKYGKCEKCGNQIELERLEAMPEAAACIVCSNHSSRK